MNVGLKVGLKAGLKAGSKEGGDSDLRRESKQPDGQVKSLHGKKTLSHQIHNDVGMTSNDDQNVYHS